MEKTTKEKKQGLWKTLVNKVDKFLKEKSEAKSTCCGPKDKDKNKTSCCG